MRGKRQMQHRLTQDMVIVLLSILTAFVLERFGFVEMAVRATGNIWLLDSFVSGLFFTSVFTTPLSIVAFGEIARASQSVFPVAFIGAFGAVCGDYIIFRFVQDRLGDDLSLIFKEVKVGRFRQLFEKRFFRWITFAVGAAIIASPLPDELGIAMMGVSRTRTATFLCISYIFNFLGILLIATIARAL